MRQGIDIVINSEYDDLGYNQQNFGGLAKAHSLDHLDPDWYISNRYIHKNYSLLEVCWVLSIKVMKIDIKFLISFL